jgi:cysteine desulfurase
LCVSNSFKKKGYEVTFLPVGKEGAVRAQDVQGAIRPHTRLITLMAANNETGVMTDLEAIAPIAEQASVPLIVDGVAWLGKERLHIPPGVSALFFSGHKIGAPKGIGFCICRQNLKLAPLFIGGEQEYHRRAGTENLPGIVILAEAIALLEKEQEFRVAHMRRLQDLFESELLSCLPDVVVNGSGPRISNTTNIAFLGVDGETLLVTLDMERISASHGSACASGALEPSRVLLEMGMPFTQARSSLRFSWGHTTTEAEIRQAVEIIVRAVNRLRSLKNNKY